MNGCLPQWTLKSEIVNSNFTDQSQDMIYGDKSKIKESVINYDLNEDGSITDDVVEVPNSDACIAYNYVGRNPSFCSIGGLGGSVFKEGLCNYYAKVLDEGGQDKGDVTLISSDDGDINLDNIQEVVCWDKESNDQSDNQILLTDPAKIMICKATAGQSITGTAWITADGGSCEVSFDNATEATCELIPTQAGTHPILIGKTQDDTNPKDTGNTIIVYTEDLPEDEVATDTSLVSLDVNSGGFYVNSPETSNFSGITISKDAGSTVANITDITIEDLRGSLVGWNLNLSIDNLSLVDENNKPIPGVDQNVLMGDTVDKTIDGTYQGDQLITITAKDLTTISGKNHVDKLNLQANPTFDTLSSLDNTGQTGNMLILTAPSQEGAGKYTFDLILDILIPAYGDYNIEGENKVIKGGSYQGELTFDLV
jgi:hypothetical protein